MGKGYLVIAKIGFAGVRNVKVQTNGVFFQNCRLKWEIKT